METAVTAKRIIYPAPMPGVPSLLVIDIPPRFRGAGLLLDRYTLSVIENDDEARELASSLAACDIDPSARPDLLYHRPSAFQTTGITLIRYDPPAPGWPWALIGCWPDDLLRRSGTAPTELSRDRYTLEMFSTSGDLERFSIDFLETLRRQNIAEIRFLAGDRMPPPGTA